MDVKGQASTKIRQGKLQQKLRKSMTDAEQRLWSVLRGRQMDGLKFRRQHPFGEYILDFVCLESMLVIEVDGSQHMKQSSPDELRTAVLLAAGFKVIRFWNNEVLLNIEAVKDSIWNALHRPHPHPNPPPEGEGSNSTSAELEASNRARRSGERSN